MRIRTRPAVLLAAALLATACHGGRAGSAGGHAPAASITVFAAASLTESFMALEGEFQAAHPGTAVTFNFAGSQALATQIKQGAPADVFAAADQTSMGKVAGLVDGPRVFTRNLLEIVVAKGNPKQVRGLADLGRRDLQVVLAAPQVPAGRYAGQALAAQHVAVKPVSLEENVKAVVTKVALGEADAGVVYATDVRAAGGKVEGVEIPAGQNVPASYPIAVVAASGHRQAAQAFVDFVRSGRGQVILQRYGFLPPPVS